MSCLFHLTDCLWTRLRCSSVDVSEELTQVLDDVVCGGLEERIHSIWAHPQHPLRRPFNKIHTATKKEQVTWLFQLIYVSREPRIQVQTTLGPHSPKIKNKLKDNPKASLPLKELLRFRKGRRTFKKLHGV